MTWLLPSIHETLGSTLLSTNPLEISHCQFVEPPPVIQSPLNKGGGSVDSGRICAGAQASAGGEGFVLDHPYT